MAKGKQRVTVKTRVKKSPGNGYRKCNMCGGKGYYKAKR